MLAVSVTWHHARSSWHVARMNISTSIKTQNTRSFNLSDRNSNKIDPKIDACILEQDDILLLTNVQIGNNQQRIKRKFLDKGYEMYINSNSNTSAGVAICLRLAKQIKVLNIRKDNNDRAIILKVMVDEEILTLVSFYDCNDHSIEHLEWVDNTINEENITQGIIIGGDVNTIKDTKLDQRGFNNRPHARVAANRLLTNWHSTGKYVDIYRKIKPEGRDITYIPDTCQDRHKPTKGRRLDQILVSSDLLIDEVDIKHTGWTKKNGDKIFLHIFINNFLSLEPWAIFCMSFER